MDDAIQVLEQGDFDPFEEERKVFTLAGQLIHEHPDMVNTTIEREDGKPNNVELQTTLESRQGRKTTKTSLTVNVYNLQSDPEIRLTLGSDHDHIYHVRVDAQPTNEDNAIKDVLKVVNLPPIGTVFRSNYGESTMPAGWARNILSSVTKVYRPPHEFLVPSLAEIPSGQLPPLLEG